MGSARGTTWKTLSTDYSNWLMSTPNALNISPPFGQLPMHTPGDVKCEYLHMSSKHMQTASSTQQG